MSEPKLPYWPAALNKKLAAAYCGLSTETFGKLCPVKPISFTGSLRGERYLRQRLDEWLVSLDPKEPAKSIKQWQSDRKSRSCWVDLEHGEPKPDKGAGGYPIVDNPEDPVKQWYDKLGFNPRTMGREDMERLQNEADERWRASIPSKPLGKLERVALGQLAEHGPNKKIPWRDVKNLGIATGERLSARGFLEVVMRPDEPDRLDHYVLTDGGLKAWDELKRSLQEQ